MTETTRTSEPSSLFASPFSDSDPELERASSASFCFLLCVSDVESWLLASRLRFPEAEVVLEPEDLLEDPSLCCKGGASCCEGGASCCEGGASCCEDDTSLCEEDLSLCFEDDLSLRFFFLPELSEAFLLLFAIAPVACVKLMGGGGGGGGCRERRVAGRTSSCRDFMRSAGVGDTLQS